MGLDNLSDAELINIIKSRNEDYNFALSKLYSKYHKVIRGFSKRILGNREDAEDNVNDVFCKVFLNSNYIQRYKEEGNFKSWILKIAHNTAINKLRKRNLQDIFFEEKMNDSQFYDENGAYSNENIQIIMKELRQMGEINSKIVYMREFLNIDYSQIEKSLNIPSSTCRGLHRKTCSKLRTALTEKYGEGQFRFYPNI